MATTLQTKLKIASWDEQPYRGPAVDGRKYTRAEVALTGDAEDEVTGGGFEALMYYRADGTSSYTSLMHLDCTLDGRAGTIVLRGSGDFDGATATGTSEIVDATGGLAGIRGTLSSSSTHADYPFMPLTLIYGFEEA